MRNHPLGIYEKALAKDLSWPERLVLAKSCGFDFVEMSVDETDERLSRLDWSAAQRTSLVAAMIETGVGIPSMCLSAHRRFPFGSRDEAVRERAREIMSKAIRLARDLGIRTIQLAGYCNFAFFSGLIDAQFWAGIAQLKSPELTAKIYLFSSGLSPRPFLAHPLTKNYPVVLSE